MKTLALLYRSAWCISTVGVKRGRVRHYGALQIASEPANFFNNIGAKAAFKSRRLQVMRGVPLIYQLNANSTVAEKKDLAS